MDNKDDNEVSNWYIASYFDVFDWLLILLGF